MRHTLSGRALLQLWLLEILGLGMGARWHFSAAEEGAATGAALPGSFFLLCLILLTWTTLRWLGPRSRHGERA